MLKALKLNICFFLILMALAAGMRSSVSQTPSVALSTVDSLKLALKNAKHDTTRCNVLSVLVEAASDQEWPAFNEQLIILSEKNSASSQTPSKKKFYLRHLANALNSKGYFCENQGRVNEALKYYVRSLKIREEVGDKNGIATSLNSIGLIYYNRGQINEALNYYVRSLKIKEEFGDKKGVSNSLSSIASIYEKLGQVKEALDYNARSLKIREKIGDKRGTATSLNNIGVIYRNQGRAKEALDYYGRSLKIWEEIGDQHGIANSFNNIGVIYMKQGRLQKALDFYGRSLKIKEEIGDQHGIANTLINIAGIYKKQGKLTEAFQYASRTLEIAKGLGYPESIERSAKLMSEIYELKGKGMQSLEMYKLYVQMRDSVKNKENQKAAFQKEAQYKYEKQRAEDSVAMAKDMQVKNVQIEKQQTEIKAKKNQQYFLFGGLGLVIIFAGFMYNRFRITQKQKGIIEKQKAVVEKQKHLVEEKQKEILDSIHYAKRIQTALITNEKYIERKLKNLMG